MTNDNVRIHRLACTLYALAIAALLPTTAAAQQPPPRRRSPAFDQRLAQTATAAQALREATSDNWRFIPDPEVGTLLWAGFTAGVDALPADLHLGSPDAAVRTFLNAHGGPWGDPVAGSSLRKLSEKTDPSGGVHLFYQQVYRGLDVAWAQLAFFAARDRSGRYAVQTVYGRYHPDIDIGVSPAIPAAHAIEALRRDVGAGLPLLDSKSDLVVLPISDGYALAWRVGIAADNGRWGGFVDATDGRIRGRFRSTRTFAGPAARPLRHARPRPGAKASRPPGARRMVPSVLTTCTGVDAFGNPRNNVPCTAAAGGGWQLTTTSNTNAAEIKIYRQGTTDSLGRLCAIPDWTGSRCPLQISTDPNRDWASKSVQGDEVSAMLNADSTLDYYGNRYNRKMFDGAGGTLKVIAHDASLLDGAYDHDTKQLAFFSEGSGHLFDIGQFQYYLSDSVTWDATAGSAELFAHEFQHGVDDAEGASNDGMSLVAASIDEGLADYFGAAFNDKPCLADTIIVQPDPIPVGDGSPDSTSVHPGCVRNLRVDINANGAFAQSALADSFTHEYGLIGASGLWDARAFMVSTGPKHTYDRGVMDAVKFWLRSTPTLVELRETVVKAVKAREGNNEFPVGLRPSYYTEKEFHDNGVGPVPVMVTLDFDNFQGLWQATVDGPPGTTFNAKMYAGTGLNNDNSVSGQLDRADNDPQFTIPGGGRLTFYPGQQGWSGSRAHSPGDGHEHAVRVRIPTISGCCGGRLFGAGDLYYYGAYDGNPFIIPNAVAARDGDAGGVPRHFAIRQALGDLNGLRVRPLRVSGTEGALRTDVAAGGGPGSPGPWNPSQGILRLLISVPETGRPARVRLRIHDLSGRLVRRVIDEPLDPGRYLFVWDGRDGRGSHVTPGVYIAALEAPEYSGSAKLVVAR